MIRAALIDGNWGFEDTDNPGVALSFADAIQQGGGVLFHVSEYIINMGGILSAITDPGSGVVISDAERNGLHGHANLSTLAQITSPTAGEVTYSLIATAAGTIGWGPTSVVDIHDKGWRANLAALKLDIPSAVDGDFCHLINSPGPFTLAVWDVNAGPADWVELAGGAVTSVDPGSGAQTGTVEFDADDITEGATNLWFLAAERASVATIAAMTTTIGTNTTLATHANIAVLNAISVANSGIIATTAEHATIADLTSPATPADDDKVWTATAGVGAWTTFVPGGAGTVTSVNTISDVGGNVTLTMTNMTEGATNKILTQTERTSIANSANVAASNATAIARLKGQQTLTFTAALAFNASSYLNATVTLTSQTKPALLTGVAAGETAKLTLIQDDPGGHHVDWSNFDGDPKISKSQGSKTTVEIYIESPSIQRVGVVSQSGNYMGRVISHPNATFDGIGGGATAIYDRVIATTWSWSDVRKYEYGLLSDLQWYMPNFDQVQHDKVASVKANAPNMKILAMTRYDLWWMFDETGVEFTQYEWGGTVHATKPTFAMGETPIAFADPWSTAQTNIQSAGYTQTARHATMTDSGALLSLPYEIILDPTGNEWNCRNNVMKVNDDDWLELYSDHIVALRAFEPNVDGYHINVEKLQYYQTAVQRILTNQLWGWMQDVSPYDNPNWVLATNSGGTGGLAAWGANGVAGTVLSPYSDRNEGSTMLDIYEGAEKLALMLRRKDPTAFIYFSPFNFTVNGHLNAAYLDDFQVAYIAREGGTTADSDAYQAALISRMASVCDAIEFPSYDTGAFSADWAQQIRASGKAVIWTVPPQDISILSNQ